MKKFVPLIIFFFLMSLSYAQVGINTITPKATLDIIGKPSISTELDGVIPPRLTGNELNNKMYTTEQTGAMVFITTPRTDPDNGQTSSVQEIGYYLFNGTNWIQIKTVTPGTVLNMVMVSPNGSGDIDVTSTSYKNIASTTYTRVSTNSTLFIEYYTNYDISGSNEDSWASRITAGGIEIVDGYQNFRNAQGGGGRSGVLWPLSGKYTGTDNPVVIFAQARRKTSDDTGTFRRDGSSWFKITEVAN